MKSEGTIKHKLKQVRFRHLKKQVAAALRPTPPACAHNRILSHPLAHGDVRVCIHPDQEEGENICDVAWEGCSKAKQCDLFAPRTSKEDAKVAFKESLAEMTFAEIAFHYPDMAALMWTLDQDTASDDWEGVPERVSPVWVDLYGVKLLAETKEAQLVLGDFQREIAEARKLVEVVEKLRTRVGGLERANQELISDRSRSLGQISPAQGVGEIPQPWWRRLLGGWFG